MKSLFAIMFFFVGLQATATTQPRYLNAVEFMNNFETIEQHLNGLREFNLISQTEHKAILQILEERKISTTTSLVKSKANGLEIKFGKNALIYKDETTFQTKDGVYIRLGENDSADKVFAKTLKAFETQKTSSLFSLVVPTAYAQNVVTDAISSGLYTVGYHGLRTWGTVLAAIGGGGANLFGFIFEPLVISISNLLHKGTVKCSYNGGYELDAGFNYVDWKKEYAEGVRRYHGNLPPGTPPSAPSITDGAGGYFESVAGFANGGIEVLGNALVRDANGTVNVSASGLKLAWPNKKAPPCDDKNAAILQKAIKNKATIVKNEMDQIVLKLKATKAAPASKAKDSKTRN